MIHIWKIPPRAWILVIGCLICQMGAGLFYASRALSPDVIADLGWTRTMWSSAVAPMLFVSSIAQAFVGGACVRYGVRPVLVVSLLCLASSFAILSAMQSLWHFYVAMVVLALGNAGIGDVSIGAVITRWFDRWRGVALGIAFVGTNLGGVVFLHVMTRITAELDWRRAALAVGLGGVAMILPVAYFAVRDPRPGEGEHGNGDDASSPDASPQGSTLGVPSLSLRPALRRPAFWILFYTVFCYALVQLGMVDHLILYLMDLGYSREAAAGALQLAVGAGIVAKLGAGIVALRISPKAALITNTALMTLGLILVPFAADARVLTLFGLLFGISTAARDVLVPLVVGDVFGVRYFGQVFGVLMFAFFPGGGLGPLALAAAHDVLGSYQPGFFACIALMATALIGLFLIPKSPRHSA